MVSHAPNQTTLELHSMMYGDCPEDGTYDGIDPPNDKMWLRTSTENSEGNPPAYVPEWGVLNDEVGIGNFLGDDATRILSGIHPDDCEDDNYGGFICQSSTDTHHVIILSQDLIAAAPPGKNWAEYEQDALIPTEVINQGLTGRFYADWCIKTFGVQEEDLLWRDHMIQDYTDFTVKYIQDSLNAVLVNEESNAWPSRFQRYFVSRRGSDTLNIIDARAKRVLSLARKTVYDPWFRLFSWFVRRTDRKFGRTPLFWDSPLVS
ncbi:hypothetical protein CPB85DRAFT_1437542 [Mucidula mucida]|nr:hypothetical protein CPB85DRAFT_1437542 [Mucidula mucida]